MKKYNKGIAIFIALMLMFLLSMAVIAVLLTAYNYNSISEVQIKRLKAIASAEGGINYAYWKMRVDSAYPTTYNSEALADTIGINSYTIKIWVTGPVSGRYTVKSKVSY